MKQADRQGLIGRGQALPQSSLIDEIQAKLSEDHRDPRIESALAVLAKLDVPTLGLGARRIVVALDDERVAKLAWRGQGLLDNEIEWRLYQRAVDDLKRMLCPCLDLRPSGVLIQQRCLPVAFEALGDIGTEAMVHLTGYGISDVVVNLGLIGEHLVCYDYSVLKSELFSDLFRDLPEVSDEHSRGLI